MARQASIEPRCLINSLSEEVLERILELAAKDPEDWDYRDAKTMRNTALVCKAWLRPARRLLLRHAPLRYAGQAMLLFRLLDKNPSLRPLVQNLNCHDLWKESPPNGLPDLLHLMPNLESLAVYVRHCHPLRNHPVWQQLNSLKVIVNEDDRFLLQDVGEVGDDPNLVAASSFPTFPGSEDFPRALQTLKIAGKLNVSGNGSDWSRLSFPNVTKLILGHSRLQAFQGQISEAVQLLPSLPRLKSFEAYQCIRSEAGEHVLTKIIRENSANLEHLKLQYYTTGRILLTGLLPLLENLRMLDLDGPLPDIPHDTLRSIFPTSLRRLDIFWEGTVKFGIDLLGLLHDEANVFLPNLEAMSNLLFRPRLIAGLTEENVPRTQLEKLLKAAARAHMSLAARGVIRRSRYSHPHDLHPLSREIICLPFPLAYKSSVPDLQREVMNDLEARGELLVDTIC